MVITGGAPGELVRPQKCELTFIPQVLSRAYCVQAQSKGPACLEIPPQMAGG